MLANQVVIIAIAYIMSDIDSSLETLSLVSTVRSAHPDTRYAIRVRVQRALVAQASLPSDSWKREIIEETFRDATPTLSLVRVLGSGDALLMYGDWPNLPGLTADEVLGVVPALQAITSWMGTRVRVHASPVPRAEALQLMPPTRYHSCDDAGTTTDGQTQLVGAGTALPDTPPRSSRSGSVTKVRKKRRPRRLTSTDLDDSAEEETNSKPSRGRVMIRVFGGERSKISYSVWKLDVARSRRLYSEKEVLDVAYKRLDGDPAAAAANAMRSIPDITLDQFLDYMDRSFAPAKYLGPFMKRAYGLRQLNGESVTAYHTRVCQEVADIYERFPGQLPEEREKFTRDRFFEGLQKDIASAMSVLEHRMMDGEAHVTLGEIFDYARVQEAKLAGRGPASTTRPSSSVSKESKYDHKGRPARAHRAGPSPEDGGEDTEARSEGEAAQETNSKPSESAEEEEETEELPGFPARLAQAMEQAQKSTKNCFACDSPDHFIKDCPQLKGKYLNPKAGGAKKGKAPPRK